MKSMSASVMLTNRRIRKRVLISGVNMVVLQPGISRSCYQSTVRVSGIFCFLFEMR